MSAAFELPPVAGFVIRPGDRSLWYLPLIVALTGVALAILPLKLAALAVGGSIIFLAGLIHPKLALYLLVPAIPFGPVMQTSVGGLGVGPVEALLGLMLVAWLLKMAARHEIIIPHPPLLWPFLLFLAAVGGSWLRMFSLTAGLTETLKWLEMLALYLFIAANGERADIPRLTVIILLSGAAQAALGLYQFVFKVGPEGFLLFGGRFLRAYGTFRQPNPYAGYLGLVWPLALTLSLWALARWRSHKTTAGLWWLGLAAGSAALVGAGLVAGQSRGALLGLAAATVIAILFMGGRWAVALGAGLIGGALLISMGASAYAPALLRQRFADITPYIGLNDVSAVVVTNANFAIIERLAHWQAARQMWLEHLWLGVGFGNYEAIYPAYAVGRWLAPLGHAHNYLLNIGAEAGFIGLLGYILFWAWVIGFTLRVRTMPGISAFQQAIVAGSLGIFSHLHLHNLVDNLYVQGIYLHVTVIFGLITLIAQQGHHPKQREVKIDDINQQCVTQPKTKKRS